MGREPRGFVFFLGVICLQKTWFVGVSVFFGGGWFGSGALFYSAAEGALGADPKLAAEGERLGAWADVAGGGGDGMRKWLGF